jgi:hypothetical protein
LVGAALVGAAAGNGFCTGEPGGRLVMMKIGDVTSANTSLCALGGMQKTTPSWKRL